MKMKKKLYVCLILAAMALFVACVGTAEPEQRIDTSGQWLYVLEDGGATIIGCEVKPEGDLAIPSELDGYAVTGIGRWAFSSNRALIGVTIPASVTDIEENPFSSSAIRYIRVASENPVFESIDGVLFDKEQKRLVSYPHAREGAYAIPEGTLQIGESAFYRCEGLTSVTIPDSVTRIGSWAFAYCRSLTSVNIPEGVTQIGDFAFSSCTGLTSMNIPNSVTDIEGNPFARSKLTRIDVEANHPVFESVDGVLFNKQQKMLVAYPDAREGTYSIPEGTLIIGDSAFTYCVGLTNVTIPDGVTHIGAGAFGGCKGLTSLTIPDSVVQIGYVAFAHSGLTNLIIPDSVTCIGDSTFEGCESLISVTLSANITRIGDWTFAYCNSLTGVIIPEGVTYIGRLAFYDCTSLTSITIPASVTSIPSNPFMDCPLTRIDVSAGNPVFESVRGVLFNTQQKALVAYPGAKRGAYTIPKGTLLIGDSAFYGCDRLTSVTIPSTVTHIGDSAFEGCDRLTRVTIPDSVTQIGNGAFRWCYRLTRVTIPDSVVEIGWNAFERTGATLRVRQGSFAEQYAKDNEITYAFYR